MELLGNPTPRVYTEPLRELTPATSMGFQCIEFAHDVLGITLLPWQQWLLIHALELRIDGTFRFDKVLLLVARQNGKTTLMQVLTLWRMYCLDEPMIIGTAQNLSLAEETWQSTVSIAEGVPELSAEISKVVKNSGKKELATVGGARYLVQPVNRGGGRSLSADLILLDELREHKSWDAWGGITKTTAARPNPQIWCVSNAGDAMSVVLSKLRTDAHVQIGNPDSLAATTVEAEDNEDADVGAIGIFEWSAKPGRAVTDREGWKEANPSLGHVMRPRVIQSAVRTDPEWIFRTEVLCQWPAGTIEGSFPAGTWESCHDATSKMDPAKRMIVGVDVSVDRTMTSLCIAGSNMDGTPHIEVPTAPRPGLEWVAAWVKERQARGLPIEGVALQGKGAPVSELAEALEAAGITVYRWQGGDLTAGCGLFFDMVSNAGLRHLAQPVLDEAARGIAIKPLGDSWCWDRRKSTTDASPVIAATAAVWALIKARPVKSAYEDRSLMVV